MAFKLVTVQPDGSAASTARTLGNVLVDAAIAPIRSVMSSNEYVSKQEQGIASLVGLVTVRWVCSSTTVRRSRTLPCFANGHSISSRRSAVAEL